LDQYLVELHDKTDQLKTLVRDMIGRSRPQLFYSVMTGTTLNCKPWPSCAGTGPFTAWCTVYVGCIAPTKCVTWFSQQLGTVYINCSNLMLFLIQMQCVLCEVKSELLHMMYMNFRFQHYMQLSG